MSAYAVALLHIHDRERYAQYEAGFLEVFAQHPGEILVVDEQPTVAEGTWQLPGGEPITRTVLLRFPDQESIERWYNSPEYQEIVQHRFAGATASVAIVRGFAPA